MHAKEMSMYPRGPLQSSFAVNNIALVNGRPQLLNLKDLIYPQLDSTSLYYYLRLVTPP